MRWGVVQVSLATLIVIASMIALFVLALVLRIPHSDASTPDSQVPMLSGSVDARISPRMPSRNLAVVDATVAVLNAAAWLRKIIPSVFSADPASLVSSSGLLTNPVFVQDLAVWLPLLTVASVAAWRRTTWGLLVNGAMLVMFVLESMSISTDQWFGSRADPSSDLASGDMTPVFAVVALVLTIPLVQFVRNMDRGTTARPQR